MILVVLIIIEIEMIVQNSFLYIFKIYINITIYKQNSQ